MNEKISVSDILDTYEKRFVRKALEKNFYIPSENDIENIKNNVKKMIGYNEALIPEIKHMKEEHSDDLDSFILSQLSYTTWDGVCASASLYMPKTDKKIPLAFLVCGHGEGGRLYYCYRRMAEKIASLGIAVIVPDNIGQGDRKKMGHKTVISPFYAGITLQGLIVMESVALIRYMRNDKRFDTSRFAALGNSGGGTQTMLLAALCPELAVISSSGYPSEFHYLFSKEKKHCSCNLLCGAMTHDMWEIYSTFSPKPLLLESGCDDNYFPMEYFERCQRKVKEVYSAQKSVENFEKHLAKTKHGWEDEDILVISEFIARRLGAQWNDTLPDTVPEAPPEWHINLPNGSLDVDQLVEKLTGKKMPEGTKLSDIFKPTLDGSPIDKDDISGELERGEATEIFAQMECALRKI